MRRWPATVIASWIFASALARAQDDIARARAIENVRALLAQAFKIDAGEDRNSPVYRAMRDFAASLVASNAFVESLVASSKPWMEREDLVDEIKARAYEAAHAGITALPGEDLEWMLRRHALLLAKLPARECAKAAAYFQLFDDDTPTFGGAPDDVARMLTATRTVYLAGLAREPGAPMPAPEVIVEARNAALRLVAPSDVAAATAVATNAARLGNEQACVGALAYRRAVLDLPGDAGDALRRHTVVDGFRKSMVARANAVTPSSTEGFTPGPVGLRYPAAARRAGMEGQMVVRIRIDATGSATDVRVMSRKFDKSSVKSNGVVVTAAEMFDPAVERYFRAGKFKVDVKEGKPIPYVGEAQLNWSLK